MCIALPSVWHHLFAILSYKLVITALHKSARWQEVVKVLMKYDEVVNVIMRITKYEGIFC